MLINEAPLILAAIIAIVYTVRIAYVLKSDKRRQAQLNKLKMKDEHARDIYCRMYTRKFLLASTFFSLSLVLTVASDFIKNGLGSIVSPIIGLLSVVIGIASASYGVHILNRRSVRNDNDDDW